MRHEKITIEKLCNVDNVSNEDEVEGAKRTNMVYRDRIKVWSNNKAVKIIQIVD